MELQVSGSQYRSQLIEEVPLTLKDLSRHKLQQDVHRPFCPHPRVGVFGSLLQKDIKNLSANSGTRSSYRLGVPQGIMSFGRSRKEKCDLWKKILLPWIILSDRTSVRLTEIQLILL